MAEEVIKYGLFVEKTVVDTSYNVTFKPMILESTEEDESFEQYGAMPSPEYPSLIKNVEGNVNETVCNKNFFKILNNINKDYITVNSNNTFTINGTLQKNDSFVFSNIKLKKGTYTFSLGDYSQIKNCYYNIMDKNTQEQISFFNYTDKTVEIDEDRYLELSFVIMAGTYNNVLITPQIEAGENKTAWIEHKEQNLTFPLAEGQKLMLSDYLASDGIHHVRKQIELDGTEELTLVADVDTHIRVYTNKYTDMKTYKENTNEYVPANEFICSHFKTDDIGTTRTTAISLNNQKIYIAISKEIVSTVEKLKSYLAQQKQAGTPVIVEYPLAEEEIEPYTEKQQKAHNKILQTAKSYKNVTNIFSPDPVSPISSVNYRKDIETLLTQQNALILEGGN